MRSFCATIRQNRFTELGERAQNVFFVRDMFDFTVLSLFQLQTWNINHVEHGKYVLYSFSKLTDPILANSSAKWPHSLVLSLGVKSLFFWGFFELAFCKKPAFSARNSRVWMLEFIEKSVGEVQNRHDIGMPWDQHQVYTFHSLFSKFLVTLTQN